MTSNNCWLGVLLTCCAMKVFCVHILTMSSISYIGVKSKDRIGISIPKIMTWSANRFLCYCLGIFDLIIFNSNILSRSLDKVIALANSKCLEASGIEHPIPQEYHNYNSIVSLVHNGYEFDYHVVTVWDHYDTFTPRDLTLYYQNREGKTFHLFNSAADELDIVMPTYLPIVPIFRHDVVYEEWHGVAFSIE